MFKMVIFDARQVKDVFEGTEQGVESCDRCGDDIEIHERLVAVFDLNTEDRGARHWLDPREGGETADPGALVRSYEIVGCDREPRVWRMWARRQENPVEGRDFMHFGSEATVRRGYTHGEPAEVELTEHPEGTYWGWIGCDPEKGHAGAPAMIQPHPVMFRMQEPSGFAERVETGRGEVVRMTARAVA